MRYFLVIKYNGEDFYGFQRQNNLRTVQGEIEKVLSEIFEEQVLIKGAGRTDRGVHATGQCAHFDIDKAIKTSIIKKHLNSNIKGLHIKACKIVDDELHSRFSVKKKHYKYRISFNYKDKNSEKVYFHKKLDVYRMKQASKLFLGVHNFQNFVSGSRDNYECVIYKIKFKHFFNHLTIHFYGKSFYRYMVRNLVGALIDVGKFKATNDDILSLLNGKKTDKMLSTAPAKGLTLVKIYY